jgi:hypothetical protein
MYITRHGQMGTSLGTIHTQTFFIQQMTFWVTIVVTEKDGFKAMPAKDHKGFICQSLVFLLIEIFFPKLGHF